jgi:hypothetical protein
MLPGRDGLALVQEIMPTLHPPAVALQAAC